MNHPRCLPLLFSDALYRWDSCSENATCRCQNELPPHLHALPCTCFPREASKQMKKVLVRQVCGENCEPVRSLHAAAVLGGRGAGGRGPHIHLVSMRFCFSWRSTPRSTVLTSTSSPHVSSLVGFLPRFWQYFGCQFYINVSWFCCLYTI